MATIKDISRETGLSVGTVSRVFNNRGYISQDARDKVDEAVKKLNYKPNAIARSLSQSTSKLIGVIVPHIAHPFFSALLGSIEEAAGRYGYSLLLFKTDGNTERESLMIDKCTEYRVSGLILCSGRFSDTRLEKHEFPVVALERMPDQADFSIQCDNAKGGRLAAEHLISRKAKHLLMVSGIQGKLMPADSRGQAFEAACKEAGVECVSMPYDEKLYAKLDYKELIEQALTAYPETDGIFASSDVIAAQALQVCAARGIKVPGQMRIVGFDDTIIATSTTPTLTTIHQPIKEMAEMAVAALIGFSEGRSARGSTVMDVELIEREST